MGRIRIGLSGWSYPDWHGDFYPDDLPRGEELDYAVARFPTLEVNRTFYSLLEPDPMRDWYRTAPPGFKYAVKGSRFITHNKKLNDTDRPLANFFASGVLELKEKLGPILWQLGSNLRFDPDRIDRFLSSLPGDHETAAEMASVDPPKRNHRIRYVIEPRHESFFVPEMARLARGHGVAIAFSHASEWPYTEEITAGFVYLRLHGPDAVYSSAYTKKQLQRWASRVERWSEGAEPEDAERFTDVKPPPRKGRDVYLYFDNDSGGHAPRQATELIRILAPARKAG